MHPRKSRRRHTRNEKEEYEIMEEEKDTEKEEAKARRNGQQKQNYVDVVRYDTVFSLA